MRRPSSSSCTRSTRPSGKLRARNGKPPIDDALWGETATAFQVIRAIVIPIAGKPAEGVLGTAAGRDSPVTHRRNHHAR
jgi:hypothetical protein